MLYRFRDIFGILFLTQVSNGVSGFSRDRVGFVYTSCKISSGVHRCFSRDRGKKKKPFGFSGQQSISGHFSQNTTHRRFWALVLQGVLWKLPSMPHPLRLCLLPLVGAFCFFTINYLIENLYSHRNFHFTLMHIIPSKLL